MAQLHQFMGILRARIQLPHDLTDTPYIARRIGNHQSIGRNGGTDIAIGGDQGPDEPGQIRSVADAQCDDLRHELLGGRRGLLRIGREGLGLGNRHHKDLIALVNHTETMGIEHAVKQPSNTFTVQRLAGHHGDPALHFGAEDHRLTQDARYFFDHITQLGIVHSQLPALLRSRHVARGQRCEQGHCAKDAA